MSSIIASPAQAGQQPAAPGPERLAEIRAAVERESVALAGAAYLPPSHAMLRDLLAENTRLAGALASALNSLQNLLAAAAEPKTAEALAAELAARADVETVLVDGPDVLTVNIRPASHADWVKWVDRFQVPVASITSRGSVVTAKGHSGGVRVLLVAHGLDRLNRTRVGLMAEQRHLLDPMDAAWVAMATRAEAA